MNSSPVEMKMVLAMVTRSMMAIENAQSELAIQHRDLKRQTEWIKDEIRKFSPPDYPDLSKCPSCGGPADNGTDREFPPNVYACTRCSEKLGTGVMFND